MNWSDKLLVRLYLLTIRFEGMSWLNLRRWIAGKLTRQHLPRLNIFANVFIEGWEGLRFGDGVSLNRGCNISAAGGLTIGNHVSIGHDVSIITGEHQFSDPDLPIRDQPVTLKPVAIGSNVWIGAKSCILAGVTLADGTIVAAGSVVKHSVTERDCTIAGVPAVIKRRRSPSPSRFQESPPSCTPIPASRQR